MLNLGGNWKESCVIKSRSWLTKNMRQTNIVIQIFLLQQSSYLKKIK